MNAQQLEYFLHTNISASRALGITVRSCAPDSVVLDVPFAANCNHHHSIFGGSMVLSATLCAWALVHIRLPEAEGKIVVQESNIRYLKPAKNNLRVVCKVEAGDEVAWQKCRQMLEEKGKGRIELVCGLYDGADLAAEFVGRYVVWM